MLTIKDIARECGCSVSTVSRVLNNHPDVKTETKLMIEQVVSKHNFFPNGNAKNLKQNETLNVLIIVHGIQNVFFTSIIERLQKGLDNLGFFTVLQFIDEQDNEVEVALKLLREIKPCGIVFLGGNKSHFDNKLLNIKIPCILLTSYIRNSNFKNLACVSSDDIAGGKAAIDYLYSCGHRKIGILGGDYNISYASELRLQGCMESIKENQIDFDFNKQYRLTRFNLEPAYYATKELISVNPELTAVFAMSDVTAVGAISAITDMGLGVPNDVSVIGYDGIELGKFSNPKLTTIVQPVDKIIELGIKTINEVVKIGGRPESILLKSTLLVGGSTRHI